MTKTRIHHLLKKKQAGDRLVMLTAYDYTFAKLIDGQEIDLILVGDSLGNVVLGYDTTIPVTMADMVSHCRAVSRGVSHSVLVVDMPFMSYQISLEKAKENAAILIQEGRADAVKIEVNSDQTDVIRSIVESGIPVMGHLGFVPQSVNQLGGYRVQGRGASDADELVALAKGLEAAGCFSIVLEMVPMSLAKRITESLSIPTIGVGAGPDCDGQVLVSHDVFGLSDRSPTFSKRYVHLKRSMSRAVRQFKQDVEQGTFPTEDHGFV